MNFMKPMGSRMKNKGYNPVNNVKPQPSAYTGSPQEPNFGGGYSGPPAGVNTGYTQWQLPFKQPTRFDTSNPDGTLKDAFTLDVTKERPDSPWFQQQTDIQQGLLNNNRNMALQDSMTGQTSAWNSLAAGGGLDSGARERIAMNAQRGLSNNYANLSNQTSQNLANFKLEDTANQINADKWNIGNSLDEIQNQWGADSDIFNTKAQAYSAEQIANGYDNAGEEKKNWWDTGGNVWDAKAHTWDYDVNEGKKGNFSLGGKNGISLSPGGRGEGGARSRIFGRKIF